MDVEKEEPETQRLLTIVDAYNKQQITFSQCVTLFSSVHQSTFHLSSHLCAYIQEVVTSDDGQTTLSILQKIQPIDWEAPLLHFCCSTLLTKKKKKKKHLSGKEVEGVSKVLKQAGTQTAS